MQKSIKTDSDDELKVPFLFKIISQADDDDFRSGCQPTIYIIHNNHFRVYPP